MGVLMAMLRELRPDFLYLSKKADWVFFLKYYSLWILLLFIFFKYYASWDRFSIPLKTENILLSFTLMAFSSLDLYLLFLCFFVQMLLREDHLVLRVMGVCEPQQVWVRTFDPFWNRVRLTTKQVTCGLGFLTDFENGSGRQQNKRRVPNERRAPANSKGVECNGKTLQMNDEHR